MPALVPLLVARRGRLHPAPRPPQRRRARRRCWSPTRSASRSGPVSRPRCSGRTGTRSPARSANRRCRGRWSPGRSARPRCATTSRPARSRSSPPKASAGGWAKSTSSPTARRRHPRHGCFGPGFRQVGYERVGRLYVRRFATPGPEPEAAAAAHDPRGRAWLPHQRGTSGRHRPGLTPVDRCELF